MIVIKNLMIGSLGEKDGNLHIYYWKPKLFFLILKRRVISLYNLD